MTDFTNTRRWNGLIAATYTPLHRDGRVHLDQVGPVVDHLLSAGVDGLYVCGSTGEAMSLTTAERRSIAEAYVKASAGRSPVMIQVGHNSLAEARNLAAHAQDIGADAISATAPSYYKIGSVDLLVESIAEVAGGAPDLPFYYYHIPILTGVEIDTAELLGTGSGRIPNLVGLKFTNPILHEYQRCVELEDGRFDVLWGSDEMLLGALATGALGAIGSTYNIAAPLYRRLVAAFTAGDLEEARRLQSRAIAMIRTIGKYPFHPATKEVLRMLGVDCGPCRLPQPRLLPEEVVALRRQLETIGFFQWATETAEVRRP